MKRRELLAPPLLRPPAVDVHVERSVGSELDPLGFEERALQTLGKIGQTIGGATTGSIDYPLPRDLFGAPVEHPPDGARRQPAGEQLRELTVAHHATPGDLSHQLEHLLLCIEALTFDVAMDSSRTHSGYPTTPTQSSFGFWVLSFEFPPAR